MAWINACASPAGLPEAATAGSVRELYRQALLADAPAPMPRALAARPGEGHPFWEAAGERLRRDFRARPNPRLILYVYPHLAADGAPIPGYATWFHVFEREPALEVLR